MENYVAITVVLKNGKQIEYQREARGEDYLVGSISFRDSKFERIISLEEFIENMKERQLLSYTSDLIDVDDFIETLKKQNGPDFEPDEDVEWYSYDCQMGKYPDSPNMVGADGYTTLMFWEEYHENKENLNTFLKNLERIDSKEVDRIEAHLYDEDEDGEVFLDETFSLVLSK